MKGKDTLVILMHDTKDVSNSSNVLQESIEYFSFPIALAIALSVLLISSLKFSSVL